MSDQLNLREIIRDVIATQTKVWPIEEVVVEVVDSLDGDDLREALRQALPLLVRDILGEHRPQGKIGRPTHNVTGRREIRPPSFSHGTGRAKPLAELTPKAPAVPTYGSRKGSEIRDAWQRVLDARYAVAGGDHKRLGDCTSDDLHFMARMLDVQSADLQSRARGFRDLATTIDEYNVTILRELPAEVLMNALGGK